MDLLKIDQAITKYSQRYASAMKEGKVKKDASFAPDFSIFDKLSAGGKKCTAFRMLLKGELTNKRGLKKRLKAFSKATLLNSKQIDDIDGDGKKDRLYQYSLYSGKTIPLAPDGEYCRSHSWDKREFNYQPFLYVFKFSTGGYAMIESTAFLINSTRD